MEFDSEILHSGDKQFSELNPGDTFIYTNRIWLKMDTHSDWCIINAVGIVEGDSKRILPGELVKPVRLKVVLA